MDTIQHKVILNAFGFYELENKPGEPELAEYYQKKYYQEEKGTYSAYYSDEEIRYFLRKIERVFHLIAPNLEGRKSRMLDVGCGEGYSLDFFSRQGWEVTGIDYSDHGCRALNPHCLKYFVEGDVPALLKEYTAKSIRYDVIWLDNVLEHVPDPLELLQQLLSLCSEDGRLVVEVPNDFSFIQKLVRKENLAAHDYWVAVPDHLSYFSRDGLRNVCKAAGWKEESVMADFPIDFFLLNRESNFVLDRSKGKAAHHARVLFENNFASGEPEKEVAFYAALAEAGLGRTITGIYSPLKK